MTIENEKLGISFKVIGVEGFKDWIINHDSEVRAEVIDECKDAILMTVTESFIWRVMSETAKDKGIQTYTDSMYGDFEDMINTVSGKLKEKK